MHVPPQCSCISGVKSADMGYPLTSNDLSTYEKAVGMSGGKKQNEKNGFMLALAYLMHLGITIVVCIAIGLFAGIYLDRWLGTSPWLLLLFLMLGIGAAFKSIIDFAKKL